MSENISCNREQEIYKTAIHTASAMKLKICIWFLFSFCLLIVPIHAQQLVINEFMASNGTTIADEDGDYADWIELYNFGDSTINLHGWYLSDDISNPYRWRFPAIDIQAGEYLLIWASGKNRRSAQRPLHTNFSISKDGETLILSNPEGIRQDEVWPKSLERDMAYGRSPDGTGSWQFMTNPSPAAPNKLPVSSRMLLHYWLFDDGLENNLPFVALHPAYSLAGGARLQYTSCLTGYPFTEEHPFWRLASLERRNKPTPLNYRPEGNSFVNFPDAGLKGMQIKQPFKHNGLENTVILHVPTTGFTDVILRFAAMDEGAADAVIIDYALDQDDTWTSDGIETDAELASIYQLFEIDFSDVQAVNHNPHFRIRLRFKGNEMQVNEGKRVTLNNISLDATPLQAHYIHATHGKNGIIHPYGFNRVYDGNDLFFTIYPSLNYAIEEVTANGTSLTSLMDVDHFGVGYLALENIRHAIELYSTFQIDPEAVRKSPDSLFIYPNPASNQLTIRSDNDISAVRFNDINGNTVLNQEFHTATVVVETGILKPGLYIVTIIKANREVKRKVLIIR